MLILNKNKSLVIFFVWLFLVALFFFNYPALALSATVRQVKLKNSPVIYFLNHQTHTRRAYLNPTAYLSYGNKWSDIKIISLTELNKWPEVVLVRVASRPEIYYIKGRQKTLIHDLADLNKFNLRGRPILELNQIDLTQYTLASYEEIGLEKKTGDSDSPSDPVLPDSAEPPLATAKILVSSEALISTSTILSPETLVANTKENLLGIFNFQAVASEATISSLVFNISGVYNSSLIGGVVARDGYNIEYKANVNWHRSDEQIIINFSEPLQLAAGERRSVKIYADLVSCPSCLNQSLFVELKNSGAASSSRPLLATWPLKGETFKIIDGSNTVAALRAEEESLAGENLMINNGSRFIGKFKIFEDSGREEGIIKHLVFDNTGTAGKDDWNNFRLLRDGAVISRVAELNSDRQIDFSLSYLRVSSSSPVELVLSADLKSGYSSSSTFNLQLDSLEALGKTYNLLLYPEINNLAENYILN